MDSIFSDQAPVSVSAVAASNRIQGNLYSYLLSYLPCNRILGVFNDVVFICFPFMNSNRGTELYGQSIHVVVCSIYSNLIYQTEYKVQKCVCR